MRLNVTKEKEAVLAVIEGDFPMDKEVLAVLPVGSKVLSAHHHGRSAYAETGRVDVELPDGEVKQYFLKLTTEESGPEICLGEHTALSLIDGLIPGMVPKPLAWGKYASGQKDTFFLIENFHHLDDTVPSPEKVAQRLAQLHGLISPNGKFGFDVPTHQAIAPHPGGWESSWTEYFKRILRAAIESDARRNGSWPELSTAAEHLLETVVPTLLDPLQSGPNPIKPRLIHGDVWARNVGTDKKTGEMIFVDTGCFYGHNELDLGAWRRPRAENLGRPYLDAYKRIFPPSEPKDAFDDRNRLYSMKFDLNVAACEKKQRFRTVALNNMLYLLEKYSKTPIPGLAKYDPSKDPSAVRSFIFADE